MYEIFGERVFCSNGVVETAVRGAKDEVEKDGQAHADLIAANDLLANGTRPMPVVRKLFHELQV